MTPADEWIKKCEAARQAEADWNNLSSMAIANIGGNQISPYQGVAKQIMAAPPDRYNTKVVFDGRIRVVHVDNGFVVEIYKEVGNEAASVLIAKDIKEVNDLIAAAMVQFRLEDKN